MICFARAIRGGHDARMDFISALLLLIIVTDPLGNVPLLIICLDGVAPERRRAVIVREVFFAFVIMSVFLFFGPALLRVMSLSEEALQVAGGIILFLISIKLIFPTDSSWLGVQRGVEPLVFPVAVPLVAGPSAITTVMLLGAQNPHGKWIWFVAIVAASLVSLVVFFFADMLQHFMGDRGIAAIQRLMGMLLTVVAVQMLISGYHSVIG